MIEPVFFGITMNCELNISSIKLDARAGVSWAAGAGECCLALLALPNESTLLTLIGTNQTANAKAP